MLFLYNFEQSFKCFISPGNSLFKINYKLDLHKRILSTPRGNYMQDFYGKILVASNGSMNMLELHERSLPPIMATWICWTFLKGPMSPLEEIICWNSMRKSLPPLMKHEYVGPSWKDPCRPSRKLYARFPWKDPSRLSLQYEYIGLPREDPCRPSRQSHDWTFTWRF